jgi:hypothetical protein
VGVVDAATSGEVAALIARAALVGAAVLVAAAVTSALGAVTLRR